MGAQARRRHAGVGATANIRSVWAWPRWGELEERRQVGVWTILNRLKSGECFSQDVVEVLRLGLIGGGLSPVEAKRKVAFYGEDRPIEESRIVAFGVLGASMARLPGDETET